MEKLEGLPVEKLVNSQVIMSDALADKLVARGKLSERNILRAKPIKSPRGRWWAWHFGEVGYVFVAPDRLGIRWPTRYGSRFVGVTLRTREWRLQRYTIRRLGEREHFAQCGPLHTTKVVETD